MAVVAHYVYKVVDPGDMLVDGVFGVLLAIDDAVDTTAALIQARGVTVLNAAGFALPTGYFNSNRAVVTAYATAGEYSAFSGKLAKEAVT